MLGPKLRAGLKDAPVKGPMRSIRMNRVVPIMKPLILALLLAE